MAGESATEGAACGGTGSAGTVEKSGEEEKEPLNWLEAKSKENYETEADGC